MWPGFLYKLLTTISNCDTIFISSLDILKWKVDAKMSGLTEKIRRVYVPMTETGFYILFCLQKERHGYSITQKVKELTDGQLSISPGTMYGTLYKMEKDGLIAFVREEEKRRLYQITELGQKILNLEVQRIERLYRNSKEDV